MRIFIILIYQFENRGRLICEQLFPRIADNVKEWVVNMSRRLGTLLLIALSLLSFRAAFAEEPERIIVKFKEDSGVRLRPRGLIGPAGTEFETLRSLITPHAPRRLFRAKSESQYETETRLRRQRKPKLTNRNLYIELVVSDPDAANDLLTQLRQAPLVELRS